MEGTFLDIIRAAHQDGDLTEVPMVKRALMYQNYRDSSNELKKCLSTHPQWRNLDATQDAPGQTFPEGIPPFAKCALPLAWLTSTGHLARIEPAEKTITRFGTPHTLEILADKHLPAEARCALFNDLCEHDFKHRPRLWVFHGILDKTENTARLLMDLGLFSELGKSSNTRYLLFEMDFSARRKPTWADAELAWFFDAAPDAPDHGWTRSLASGGRGFREWIVNGEHVEQILDVLLVTSRDMPEEPPRAFWDYHKSRIEAARNGHGDNP